MSEIEKTQNADEMLERVKGRNMAIALSLLGFVVLIFAITIIKLGPDVLGRPL